MNCFRDHIEAMTAYVPGDQPRSMSGVVKLNQNENPYPPSPAALRLLREFDGSSLRLYPDPIAREFCAVAGEVLGVPAERLCVGDGSDDLIMMIARAAAGAGRAVVVATPTFPYYYTQAQIENAPVIEVSANEDFSLPIEAMAGANGAVTFLTSPNSPTGAAADADQVDWLAGKLDGLLVVDEAYVDFAADNAVALTGKHENLIILRSLSKGYSLAGLRLGFAVAAAALLEGLLKTKAIYNVGTLPAAVGAAAMADQEYHRQCVGTIVAERVRLAVELARRGFHVWPSQGNFLLTTVPSGDGKAAQEALKARSVLVRYYNEQRMVDMVRISVGTPEQDTALLDAVDACGIGSQP